MTRIIKSIKVGTVYDNVEQDIITITHDKLELILRNYENHISRKGAWVSPLGIVITIIATFSTANFTEFLGLSADVWKSVFFMCGVLSCIWLVVDLVKRKKSLSIDELLDRIKNKSAYTENLTMTDQNNGPGNTP